jgi:tRNA modification GTPase
MSKTETIVKKADMIIWLIDGSRAFDNDDKKILKLLKNKKYLKVINKADKRQVIKDACIKISAKNHQIDDLLNNIKKEFKNIKVNDNDFILQSTNYIALVEHTIKLITQTINALKKNLTIDIQASVLHEAYENLLLITGEIVNFNFINEIFKKFCIGK